MGERGRAPAAESATPFYGLRTVAAGWSDDGRSVAQWQRGSFCNAGAEMEPARRGGPTLTRLSLPPFYKIGANFVLPPFPRTHAEYTLIAQAWLPHPILIKATALYALFALTRSYSWSMHVRATLNVPLTAICSHAQRASPLLGCGFPEGDELSLLTPLLSLSRPRKAPKSETHRRLRKRSWFSVGL